jgi:hypothetical protein
LQQQAESLQLLLWQWLCFEVVAVRLLSCCCLLHLLMYCCPCAQVVIMGDGQATQGDFVVKPNVKKVRHRVVLVVSGYVADAQHAGIQ